MSWNITLGPRQAKPLEDALRAIQSEGMSYSELSGIIGQPETEHTFGYQNVFGGMRADAQAALKKLQDCYPVVSMANRDIVINDAELAYKELRKNRPVVDKRIDQAEVDDRARNAEAEAAR